MNIVSLLGYMGDLEGLGGGAEKWRWKFLSAPPKQCLVLEFMPGGSLRRRLSGSARERPLTARERFMLASDIARGLEYLHVDASPPLIHQDVKSDNILLAHYDHGDGNRIMAKVSDFGTARYAPQLLTQDHHETQNVVGTNGYMPPEYLCGHVSEKTDAFAFGVVLLELLTGEPSADRARGQMLWARMGSMADGDMPAHYDKRLGAASAWPQPETAEFARIARRCIDTSVASRCKIAGDVRVELDHLAGRPTKPRAPSGMHYNADTGDLVDDTA